MKKEVRKADTIADNKPKKVEIDFDDLSKDCQKELLSACNTSSSFPNLNADRVTIKFKRRNGIVTDVTVTKKEEEKPSYDYDHILSMFENINPDNDKAGYNMAYLNIGDTDGFECNVFKELLSMKGYSIENCCFVDPSFENHYSNLFVKFRVTKDHFLRLVANHINEMYDNNQGCITDTEYKIDIPSYLVGSIWPCDIKAFVKEKRYIRELCVDYGCVAFRVNNPIEIKRAVYKETQTAAIQSFIDSGTRSAIIDVDYNDVDDLLDIIKNFLYLIDSFTYDKASDKMIIAFDHYEERTDNDDD